MIEPKRLYDAFLENGVTKFSGVPDSLLKHFCAYISDKTPASNHVITANEGSAIALAVGQYIASGKPSLVYMQNSGFGNAINPLLSLADKKVYGIPMVVVIGWRGETGVKDEPQHVKQGAVMEAMLNACEIPYEILDAEVDDVQSLTQRVVARSANEKTPVAILVRKGTFETYKSNGFESESDLLTREEAIGEIVRNFDNNDVFVSTTGMASRELFEYRESSESTHDNDFLTVGSMGHASMIALGIASSAPSQRVVCIDGDGASLMHLGNLCIIGQSEANNLIHIVLNNGVHDSVGGQPTVGLDVSFGGISKASGYKSRHIATSSNEISAALEICQSCSGPHFVEVRIRKGARADLGRPTSTPNDNKIALMNAIENRVDGVS